MVNAVNFSLSYYRLTNANFGKDDLSPYKNNKQEISISEISRKVSNG